MIRIYCDVCGKEMLLQDEQRIKFDSDRISVEILTGINHVWNGGNICWACIVRIINNWYANVRKLQGKDT